MKLAKMCRPARCAIGSKCSDSIGTTEKSPSDWSNASCKRHSHSLSNESALGSKVVKRNDSNNCYGFARYLLGRTNLVFGAKMH